MENKYTNFKKRILGRNYKHLYKDIYTFRKKLGVWPLPHSGSTYWRVCFDSKIAVNKYDIIITSLREEVGSVLTVRECATSLSLKDGAYFLFLGERPKDWLVAFISYLDCYFQPQDALCAALSTERTKGWPSSISTLPSIGNIPSFPYSFPRCPKKLGLYPITSSAELIRKVSIPSVQTLQLRIKQPTSLQVIRREIKDAISLQKDKHIYINDYWREAIELGAYGVHLGQEDLLTANLEMIASAGLRLGLSTHGFYDMKVADHFHPSYIAIGPIFQTSTKVIKVAPIGITRLKIYVKILEKLYPTVAIGGIDQGTLSKVLLSGVDGVAVVRAITQSVDIVESVKLLQDIFNRIQITND